MVQQGMLALTAEDPPRKDAKRRKKAEYGSRCGEHRKDRRQRGVSCGKAPQSFFRLCHALGAGSGTSDGMSRSSQHQQRS